MKCPNCNVSLVMTDRSGIEIDYCPDCRGVWLDRGELDKIIERATPETPAPQQQQYQQPTQSYTDRRDYSRNDDYRYKKKKGLLGDLFDF
ncbi:hypothetical protein OA84_11005 [Kaistella solincola]|uniref:Transcription factor zinc-finger domain-containing protein n=3 Tax=Kaistella TaxID=2782231 RepID=A0A1I3NU15_9FLAO|nr:MULTISPECIES: zf-TFIIB domain-containing protein [Kaistella]KIA82390.1 hypothetical protein OA84_11005 [Kaistella solincola]SFJ12764.1 hypothetical protein SAMN05421638_2232 [Kaistella treverensis]